MDVSLLKDSEFKASGVIQRILDSVQQVGDIQRVFGAPIKQGERMVIPVAEISLAFGTGFGEGGTQGLKTSHNSGSGGGVGGGVKSRPVGVFEITDRGTRFLPVFRPGGPLLFLLLGLFLGGWLARSKQKQTQKTLCQKSADSDLEIIGDSEA